MHKIKVIVNSQISAIIIFLILNLFQLRELGLICIKINEMADQIASVEFEVARYHDLQK